MLRPPLALALLALFAPPGGAQSQLATFPGAAPGDHHAVVLGGKDLDKDGFSDLLVGAPDDDSAGAGAGAVYAYSGQTHALLWAQYGNAPLASFGYALAFTSDVNSDGVREVVVGAPFAQLTPSSFPGHVRVLSGADGAVLFTGWGDDHNEGMGWSVAGSLQWGPGNADFAGGAPLDDDGGVNSGSFRVWRGSSWLLLATVNGDSPGDALGWSMSNVFDVNLDGRQDLAVGAPNANSVVANVGHVRVYGLGGAVIWTRTGFASGDLTGWSVAPLGDVNGDNYADVLIGEPGNTDNGALAGRVRMFSGQTGFQLGVWRGDAAGDRFGTSLALLNDLDGDGFLDWGAGAPQPGTGAGYARVFTDASATGTFTLTGSKAGEEFGNSLSSAGFFTGGFSPDIAVGAKRYDGPAGSETGMARVFSGTCPGFVDYCTAGTSASGCRAQVSASGTPSASTATGFWLFAAKVEGAKDGLFFFGRNGRQANSWGNGTSYQCVAPPVKRAGMLTGQGGQGTCDGAFVQDLNELWAGQPAKNPGAGAVVQAQLWHRDPQNTSKKTTSLSNAIEFVVCP